MFTLKTAINADVTKSTWIEHMLVNVTASYKYYWLRSIFDESLLYHRELAFNHLAALMVAYAWYPVVYYRLHLGSSDKLANAAVCAQQACGLRSSASEREIIGAISATRDAELQRRLRNLCRYVPYRSIRPFYENRIRLEAASPLRDAQVNRLVKQFNREDVSGAPYRFLDRDKGIELDLEWMDFFRDNRKAISNALDSWLIDYLRVRNPKVPDIQLKIREPRMRDFGTASSVSENQQADYRFAETYAGKPLAVEPFGSYDSSGFKDSVY